MVASTKQLNRRETKKEKGEKCSVKKSQSQAVRVSIISRQDAIDSDMGMSTRARNDSK